MVLLGQRDCCVYAVCRRQLVSEVCSLVDLNQIRGRQQWSRSSGGERQPPVARALVQPRVLLLDEATTTLMNQPPTRFWGCLRRNANNMVGDHHDS